MLIGYDWSMSTLKNYWFPVLWCISIVAFISLYFTIFLPYNGEEGQYTISALEMAYRHYYWQPLSYGSFYWRPPLYNWIIIAVMHLTGASHILVAARIVAASASLLTGLMLWFLAFRIFRQKLFAILSVATFFSGDFLFRRGWIAYSDPLFALATFTAISFMWISYKEQRPIFWLPVPLALLAGILTKAFTAYIFYGTALLVIWLAADNRRYLFKPASIAAHLTAVILPIIWFQYAPNSNLHAMFGDISKTATGLTHVGMSYFKKVSTIPFELIFRFAPIDLLAFYSLYLQKKKKDLIEALPAVDYASIKLLLWIIVLSILPYWLSSANFPIRYLLPLMPLAALVFSYCIWRGGEKMLVLTIVVLIVELGLKCVSSFIGLPWFEKMNYPQQAITHDIIHRVQSSNLYAGILDNRVGLSIGSSIDSARWPQAPLTLAPNPLTKGCVITTHSDSKWGTLQQNYRVIDHNNLYLYCRH